MTAVDDGILLVIEVVNWSREFAIHFTPDHTLSNKESELDSEQRTIIHPRANDLSKPSRA